VRRDQVAGPAQEAAGVGVRVVRLQQLGVGQRPAVEPGVVEERIDPAGPGGGVEIGLRVMAVAGRTAVGGPPAGTVVAHVDRAVEMLRPQPHRAGIVGRPGLRPQLLQHRFDEGVPVMQRGHRGRVDGERRIEIADGGDVELLLLGQVGLDADQPGRRSDAADRRAGDLATGFVDHEVGALDPHHPPAAAEREGAQPGRRRPQDDLAVFESLSG
jgi:hypothetical protein